MKIIKKNLYIAGSVDSLYKARHLSTVSPVHFYKNLISYYITGSKFVTKLNNIHAPAGSYSCLTEWLKNLSKKALGQNETGNVCIFFDNNQVVARNWRVNYNYKTKASVVTTVLNITPCIEPLIQQNEDVSPSKWLHDHDDPKDTVDKIQKCLNENEQTYIKISETRVKDEMTKANGLVMDHVDTKISDDVDRNMEVDSLDNYDWVPSIHPADPPKLGIAEPVMCNPCSYASVKRVLEQIQIQSVNGRRKWAVVGCDGLPYNLSTRLLTENPNLRNLLIMPGAGHIEINAVKAIFKLLWEVAFKDLAKLLGYRTPRALVCCYNCTDHHKAWHIIKLYFSGTMDEIIRQYICECYAQTSEPSIQGFYGYISRSGPNIRFLCDSLFNYVFAVYLYRCGIRRNNTKFIMAGRSMFMKLFFVTNMTNYQEIIFKDLKVRVLAPGPVKEFIEKTESFSVSGNNNKGEGGDFILESINGKTKRWLSPGIPTEAHWLMVCRSLDTLDKIKDSLVSEFALKESKADTIYQRDIRKEILEWRVYLRKSEYFSTKSYGNVEHISLSGQKLDRDLIYFECKCTQNVQIYLQNTRGGNIPKKNLGLTPVFVTEENRTKYHDIGRKTKEVIVSIIENIISEIRELGNITEALVLEEQWIKIKASTKNDMLQFYKEVVNALEDASSENVACEECHTDSSDSSDDEQVTE